MLTGTLVIMQIEIAKHPNLTILEPHELVLVVDRAITSKACKISTLLAIRGIALPKRNRIFKLLLKIGEKIMVHFHRRD